MALIGAGSETRTPIRGVIDAASVYEVIAVAGGVGPSAPWIWEPALATTQSLLSTPHLRLAPSPQRERLADGPWRTLQGGLSLFAQTPDPSVDVVRGRSRALKYAGKHLQDIHDAHAAIKSTPEYYEWETWHIEHEWAEHVTRMGALFQNEYVGLISDLMTRSKEDIDRLFELTSDCANINRLIATYKRETRSDELASVIDAWIYAALLRGIDHSIIAGQHSQLLQHPIRHALKLPGCAIPVTDVLRFQTTPLQEVFSWLLLRGCVYRGSSQQERLQFYCDAIRTVRRNDDVCDELANWSEDGPFSEDARKGAFRLARQAGLSFHEPKLELWLDTTLGLGEIVLTTFVLHNYDAAALGVMYLIASKLGLSVGSRAARLVGNSSAHLASLVDAGPGVVRPSTR